MRTQPIALWTVYKDPAGEPPGTYVARKWMIGGGPTPAVSEETFTDTDLEALRRRIKDHGTHTVLQAKPGESPAILEVWI